MQKIINIDGRDVKFKASASLVYRYKQQFGKDLLTLIMPVINSLFEAINIYEVIQKGELTVADVQPGFDLGKVVEKLELIDLYNLIWVMAKTANKDIADPIEWYDEFEEFPALEIAKELLDILIPSLFVTEKSKKKLLKMTRGTNQ